jgi:photosynthetic reaction center cytochrome c subunit
MTQPRALLLAAVVVLVPAQAGAQGRGFIPDSFTNLKVLPKNIDRVTLLATMRGFATALGVRCEYCHVSRPRAGAPDSLEFAKDDKRTKKVARVMLHMVMHINEEHLHDVPERPTPLLEVRCATCHRGLPRPRLMDEEMTLTLADSGLDAAVRRYRELRQRYFESGAYDFRDQVLIDVARNEARAGRLENALGMLGLDDEFHPTSGQVAAALGDVYLQKGDTAKAIASYRTALTRDSTVGPARFRLRQLTGGGQPQRP